LPQLGQEVSRETAQPLQAFQSFCMGLWHFGHLSGPTGLTLPQNGHAFESGGLSWLQYLQGRLNPDICVSLVQSNSCSKIHPSNSFLVLICFCAY